MKRKKTLFHCWERSKTEYLDTILREEEKADALVRYKSEPILAGLGLDDDIQKTVPIDD